mmetsp:Transcript_27105/g.50968  ORF Transcript_27105/g.50968 Transcript_27105/m.50968 type:complete len:327 (-) Transcript_27105:106-1086(-)
MDFDELDELAPTDINDQKPKGTILEPLARNLRIPDDNRLPDMVTKRLPPNNGTPVKERTIKLRLLCTMGAADSVVQEWCYMAHDAPEDIEVITHEPPGHGTRVNENICVTLEDMGNDAYEAFKEAMNDGPFALYAHSIGCLTAVYVAERAKRELKVEPVIVFMCERGAAHIEAFSEYGMELMRTDPLAFIKIRQPDTGKACEDPKIGPQALRMWGNDLKLENDTRPIGFHTFSCPLICLRCSVIPFKVCPKEVLEAAKDQIAIHNQKKDYLGHFGPSEFKEWESWTNHERSAVIHLIEDSNHMTIKSNPTARKILWDELKAVIATF